MQYWGMTLSGRGHLKLTFMVISILRNLYQTDTEWFFCPHLSRSVIYVCQQTELSQKCNVLLFNFVFYRTFILVWFCEPSHDSINIDNVTVYLSHFTSCTCHCLWKSDISELSIVHDNAICLFQKPCNVFARGDDANIMRSGDAQCNTKESPQHLIPGTWKDKILRCVENVNHNE